MVEKDNIREFLLVAIQEVQSFIEILRTQLNVTLDSTLFQAMRNFTESVIEDNKKYSLPKISSIVEEIKELLDIDHPNPKSLIKKLEELYHALSSYIQASSKSSLDFMKLASLEAGILALCNSSDFAHQLESLTSNTSINVFFCENLEEAKEMLDNCNIDAVLLHVTSMDENAFQVCSQLKERDPSLYIYFVKSSHDMHEQIQCIRMGGETFLNDPLDHVQLFDIVSEATRNKRSYPIKVLWIDDDENFTRVFSKILYRSGIEPMTSSDAMNIFNLLYQNKPDILILDYDMPSANGLELCRIIRMNPEFQFLPIIITSAVSDSKIHKMALSVGADDFLQKPLNTTDFVARIQAKVEKAKILKSFLNTDPLTNLHNHRAFQEELSREFSRAKRYGHQFSLVIVDIDNFAEINEKYSFEVGDKVLKRVAFYFTERLRKSDILGRFGGDEIAIILIETDKQTATLVMKETLKKISEMSFLGSDPQLVFNISCSAGISSYPSDGTSPRTLLNMALSSLAEAKGKSRGSVHYFNNDNFEKA